MTQVFEASGEAVPVTVIEAGPCPVLQVRTSERDGYSAIQIGFLDKTRPQRRGGKKPRHAASRSERGHVAKLDSKRAKKRAADGIQLLAKADCEPQRYIREFRVSAEGIAAAGIEVGKPIVVDSFAEVKSVDVIGTSKGRGFAGVIKRHHFKGQRATHGVKKCHRHMGSTGCRTFPGRIFKGKRMPGQLGNSRRTSRNLKLVRVDAENRLLLVRGAVPGPNGGYVMVLQTNTL
ncbi:MAG: 50S ribosomal protein L3 [Planctomycetia bacterium]|nr:50S ribosomal protein L3 [Planctomycetia bacterium]